jgi:hypothetical protein
MNDEELVGVWTTLMPTAHQRRRIDARLGAWLDAHDMSLAAEWISLFKVAPFTTIALATASAVAIVAVTPLVWIVGRLR